MVLGYGLICVVFGRSNMTYLVFKALWPFRTGNNVCFEHTKGRPEERPNAV